MKNTFFVLYEEKMNASVMRELKSTNKMNKFMMKKY